MSYEGSHFLWKCSKLNLNFQNAEKNSENIFGFWDICSWKCYNKFGLLRREYLSSEVNELTNSPKILHISKTDFFKLNCLHSDQWIWIYCRSNFNSVSARLPYQLSQGPLKENFLDIYLPTFFGVQKFKNTSASRVILCVEMFKIESKFRKCRKNSKIFLVSEIISSENVAINCVS